MVGTSNYIARPAFSQTAEVRRVLVRCLGVLCLGAALFASCASGSAPQPPTAPSQPAAWSLTFHLSGGFAGFNRQLDLASSGSATATDRRQAATRTAQATVEELKTISTLVATAHAADVRAPGCADCFEYEVNLQSTSGRILIRANDAGMPGSDAAPLVTALNQLLTRLLNVR